MSDAHPAPRRLARAVVPLALLATACADAVGPAGSGARPSLAAASAETCGAAPKSLKVGEAAAVTDSVLCVTAEGAEAEYVLVPVNGGTNARRSAVLNVTAA